MRVPLSKPGGYTAFGKTHTSIEVSEPQGALIFVHGEPIDWVFTRERNPVRIENKEAIKAYLEAYCEPGVEVLSQLNVADSRAVKEALLDFFDWQKPAAQGSTTSSTSASSD